MGIDRETKLPCFIDDTDRCLPVNADSLAKSTSAVLADVDNDGDLDLYITNLIFTNRLYQNDGTGIFKDITDAANVRDSSLSHSSCFFDADNDGDLDFYVTNRGKNQFFINNRDGTFIQNDKLFEYMDQLAYSTGFACGDPDNDGDVDCYLANTDEDGIYYDNKLDNQNYLKIKLMGTKSNRDAIGAKTWLYEAGHLNEQDFCLGLREINGGSGYGCQNSLVQHYGVAANKKYDLKVWFPSGIVKSYQNVSPSQLLEIEEEAGLAQKMTRAAKWLSRNVKDHDNQEEFWELVIMCCLLLIPTIVLKRKHHFSLETGSQLVAFPLIFYFILTVLLFETSILMDIVLPYFIAILIYGVMFKLMRHQKSKFEREQLAEELLVQCRAFDHGSWATSYLNQLQLFGANLQIAASIPEKIAEQLKETIAGFYGEVYGSIKRIRELAEAAAIQLDQANELSRQLIFLSENLNAIKVQLAIKHRIKADIWQNIMRQVDAIKLDIKSIKNGALNLFTCEAYALLEHAVSRFREKFRYPIVLEVSKPSPGFSVNIKPAELAAILDNLFLNADATMNEAADPTIKILLYAAGEFIQIDFSDRGRGIPRRDWENIFQKGYSNKSKQNGGFGLYYSKRVLEKYGGGIEVLKSANNKGTTMRVRLVMG